MNYFLHKENGDMIEVEKPERDFYDPQWYYVRCKKTGNLFYTTFRDIYVQFSEIESL